MFAKKKIILLAAVFPILLLLAACSAQSQPTRALVTPSTKAFLATAPLASPTSKPQTAVTSTMQPLESDADQKVVRSYHTILMLGRAADLMLALIVKSNTGEIPMGDTALRSPYTDAFVVAIDAYNQTDPPSGLLNQYWKPVTSATEQSVNVYTALNQGKAISNKDYFSLKALRQIMINYQDTAERYLRGRGRKDDFFAKEHQEVEQHFLQAYGNQPLPALQEPSGK